MGIFKSIFINRDTCNYTIIIRNLIANLQSLIKIDVPRLNLKVQIAITAGRGYNYGSISLVIVKSTIDYLNLN
jgi:hypothetical protein